MKYLKTRRKMLLELTAATVAAATPKLALSDRNMLTEAAGRSRGSSCDNAGVLTSDATARVVSPTDFEKAGNCQLTKSSVEGPYFICSDANTGKNLVADRSGQSLTVALRVIDESCTPVPDAIVDVWCCDAEGNYSGHNVDPDDPEAPRGRRQPDLPERFLRGVLGTDADGIAEFDMIYPGYYAGRAIHLHFKVHVGNTEFLTSQALFPEKMNTKVMATEPYNKLRDATRLSNADDPAFIENAGEFRVFEKGSVLTGVINLSINT